MRNASWERIGLTLEGEIAKKCNDFGDEMTSWGGVATLPVYDRPFVRSDLPGDLDLSELEVKPSFSKMISDGCQLLRIGGRRAFR
jgi:hypothetical protein